MVVLNVGAGRATEPRDWLAMRDPIGPANMSWIEKELREVRRHGGIVVVAWGVNAPYRYVWPVMNLLARMRVNPYCFGITKEGHPKHPLYVARKTELVRWRGYVSQRRGSASLLRVRLERHVSNSTKSQRRIMLRDAS
jgi:hypothetical protein